MKRAVRKERQQKQPKKHVTYKETFVGDLTEPEDPSVSGAECDGGESINVDEGPEVFDGLCDRMLTALCLVQTSVSEVLDLKDELILNNVPSPLQTQLSLCTARLFRSLLDLYVPSTELVRLVRLFGPQWEQNLLTLKQMQGEHERLQSLLSLALRRVQNLETRLRQDNRAQPYRNWEKLFVRLMRLGPYKPSNETAQDFDVRRLLD